MVIRDDNKIHKIKKKVILDGLKSSQINRSKSIQKKVKIFQLFFGPIWTKLDRKIDHSTHAWIKNPIQSNSIQANPWKWKLAHNITNSTQLLAKLVFFFIFLAAIPTKVNKEHSRLENTNILHLLHNFE